MSIALSVLLLLLLGFSLHVHASRAFGFVVSDRSSVSKESEEKLNPDARVSTPSIPSDATRDDNVREGGDPKVEMETDDHDLDDESVDSVRWKVPHKKKGEPEPRFNLDYLPPKTHPPSHNR